MPLDYITDNNVNKFYFIPVTDSEVSNILGTIKDSAAGWDGLKAFIIKQIKEVIVTPLSIYVIVHSWQVFFLMN